MSRPQTPIFVGDTDTSAFKKGDARLMSIPFVTRRPTFAEVKRVHMKLSSAVECGDEKTFLESLPKKLPEKVVKSKTILNSPISKPKKVRNYDENILDDDFDVRERNFSPDSKEKYRNLKKSAKQSVETLDKDSKNEKNGLLDKEWQELYTAVSLNKHEEVFEMYRKYKELGGADFEDFELSLNRVITKGRQDGTLLHCAATSGHCEVVGTLLRVGADPMIKNSKGCVPFQECSTKLVRKEFVNFRAEIESQENSACKIDWNKAQIPAPLDPEQEERRQKKLAEKRRKERMAKKERTREENEKKQEERRENEEKNRFLSLSDREKRALAAERRLLANMTIEGRQGQGPAPVLARCFECAGDITGKVPFEYDSNRFCSTQCVKKHRTKN